ncbi:MAG: putative PIN and TRAM-domain containing protein precursor [Firmicutes bacterium ADurb.Bin182]|nr:MAG: putative PIN and TRAM-domain containing protein precursor [Firmicutes bacterium ADurb.Bin182]
MAQKLARLVITALSLALGPAIVNAVNEFFISLGYLGIADVFEKWAIAPIYIASGVAFGIIFYFISPKIIQVFVDVLRKIETFLSQRPLVDVLFGVFGLIVGLLVAFLLSTLTSRIPSQWLSVSIAAVLYIMMGYLGWSVTLKGRHQITLPSWMKRGQSRDDIVRTGGARPKILDTSVIIDGRIYDISLTGIIEGTMIIPGFVLQELRHIADSADSLKRNRGRRGLDILNSMQKEPGISICVEDRDYDDIAEVDAKLLKLAYDLGGVVVTNDYNLNKVAGVQNVPVLNINDLANAVKPVVLPGEEMRVSVVKEGKEAGQGVAYLDDGTMIVVDGGKKCVGEFIEVSVTSVLQTSAGRMIFARIK